MMDCRTFKLLGRTQYEKHIINDVHAEHVLSFTPDALTGTVTVESELDGCRIFTKEVTLDTARKLWRRMVRSGYRKVLLWVIVADILTRMPKR